MNTFERSPARATVTRPFAVASPWFTGDAEVPTFAIEELTATKIRALFQRRKGRDLFDLWLAVQHGGAAIDDNVECFEPYRPGGWTVDRALETSTPNLSSTTSPAISTNSSTWHRTTTASTLRQRLHAR